MLTEKFTFKIDVKKLDMSRVFKAQSGAEYLDFEAVPTKSSQYGDSHFIVQRQSKDERLANAPRLPICGNVKPPYKPAGTTHQSASQSATQTPAKRNGPQPGPDGSVDTSGVDSGDVPFSGAAE
jgi:hypothetical protein